MVACNIQPSQTWPRRKLLSWSTRTHCCAPWCNLCNFLKRDQFHTNASLGTHPYSIFRWSSFDEFSLLLFSTPFIQSLFPFFQRLSLYLGYFLTSTKTRQSLTHLSNMAHLLVIFGDQFSWQFSSCWPCLWLFPSLLALWIFPSPDLWGQWFKRVEDSPAATEP